MMNHGAARAPSDEEMGEIALVAAGYTVSCRRRCITRIGANYVMRDASGHCVRIPVATIDPVSLGGVWANFGHSANEMEDTQVVRDATWSGPVQPKDVALVLQGYTVSTRGVCLARVVGNYVTRDGLRRCVRFLVDTVDPAALGAAWVAFSSAAGWVGSASMGRAETLNAPADRSAEVREKRSASG
jgi:hypothetical protein